MEIIDSITIYQGTHTGYMQDATMTFDKEAAEKVGITQQWELGLPEKTYLEVEDLGGYKQMRIFLPMINDRPNGIDAEELLNFALGSHGRGGVRIISGSQIRLS